jgi:hypothetical protein
MQNKGYRAINKETIISVRGLWKCLINTISTI